MSDKEKMAHGDALPKLVRHYRRLKAPPGFAARVSARVVVREPPVIRWQWAGAAAALVLVAVLATVMLPNLRPVARDYARAYPDTLVLADASGWAATDIFVPDFALMPDLSRLSDYPVSGIPSSIPLYGLGS